MHANTMFRSNPREYVVRGLDVLLEGLTPFIEGRFQGVYGPHWQDAAGEPCVTSLSRFKARMVTRATNLPTRLH